MEVAHPPSIPPVCQMSTSHDPRSNTYLAPWPKMGRPTQKCQLRIIHQHLKGHIPKAQIRKVSSRKIGHYQLVQCATGSSGDGEEEEEEEAEEEDKKAATNKVQKLYTAIKNRNMQELSDLIGEEIRCVCNFVFVLCPFLGKKLVVDLFSSLMRIMGKNIEFVIQPGPLGGMNIGVAWSLEWDKAHVPLGKGYSFYTSHVYKGKVLIRDAEMFIDPMIKGIEPIVLGWIVIFMPIVERASGIIKHKRTRAFIKCMITVVIISILLTILRRTPL